VHTGQIQTSLLLFGGDTEEPTREKEIDESTFDEGEEEEGEEGEEKEEKEEEKEKEEEEKKKKKVTIKDHLA